MKTIYLVLPCYNEELVLKDSASKLKGLMENLMEEEVISKQSKVYFVNNGSSDRTWELLQKTCGEDGLFGAISLSANCGHQNAILSGMMCVKDEYDAVITLGADLQHDITAIPEFIRLFEESYEIVYGVRKNRQGEKEFKKFIGDAFYNVMQLSGAKIIRNHADYRLMSSMAIRALSGYEQALLPY